MSVCLSFFLFVPLLNVLTFIDSESEEEEKEKKKPKKRRYTSLTYSFNIPV